MESNQDDQQQSGQPEQQAAPTPADVKASVKKKQVKVVKRSIAKAALRKWGFFGARSLSKGLEYGGQTFELSMLKLRLDKEAEILEEYELSAEELQTLMDE